VNRAGTAYGGPGIFYRIWIVPSGGGTPVFMSSTFTVWKTVFGNPPVAVTQSPQVVAGESGWYAYLEDSAALTGVAQNALGYWPSVGDDQVSIYMEARDGLGPLGLSTSPKLVQLDNTQPSVPPALFQITSAGGSCGDFKVGDPIDGIFTASDNEALDHVAFSLEPTPKTITYTITSPPSPTFQSGTWHLDTAGLPPCGYVVRLDAVDRTIVNSAVLGWDTPAFTGFCLKA
jgi:hypothetical protein